MRPNEGDAKLFLHSKLIRFIWIIYICRFFPRFFYSHTHIILPFLIWLERVNYVYDNAEWYNALWAPHLPSSGSYVLRIFIRHSNWLSGTHKSMFSIIFSYLLSPLILHIFLRVLRVFRPSRTVEAFVSLSPTVCQSPANPTHRLCPLEKANRKSYGKNLRSVWTPA